MATKYGGEQSPYAGGGAYSGRRSVGSIDTSTSDGLYSAAELVGLKAEADRALAPHQGENGKFGSGGWLSDTFDYLNALDYGVVGMMKGRTFKEGIENRESFSDSDSLGRFGWTGKVAGFVADVLVDPLNLIPPLKIVQLMGKAGKAAKLDKFTNPLVRRAFGELKEIQLPEDLGGGVASVRTGGMAALNKVRELFEYGFGASRQAFSGLSKAYGKGEAEIHRSAALFEGFSKLDPKVKNGILKFGDDGDVQTITRDEALRNFSGKELEETMGVLNLKEELMQKLVDEGGLTRADAEKRFETYLTQQYDQVISAKASSPNGKDYQKSVSFKARKDMTPEERAKLGQVTNPDVLLGATLTKMTKLYQDILVTNSLKGFSLTDEGLQSLVAKGDLTLDDAKKMFTKVDDINKYKTRAREFELKRGIKETSDKIVPVLKTLQKAFKDDAVRSKELEGLTSWIEGLTKEGKEAAEDIIDNLNLAFTGKIGDDVGEAADKSALSFAKERYNELGKIVKSLKEAGEDMNLTKAQRAEAQRVLVESEFELNRLRETREQLQFELAEDATSQLAGRYLPKALYDQMKSLQEPSKEFGQGFIMAFKNATVVWNPASTVRNGLSAVVQSWYKLGAGALNPLKWVQASRVVFDPQSPVLRDMGEHGLSMGSGQITELSRLAMNEYTAESLHKQFSQKGQLRRAFDYFKKTMNTFYQTPDNIAKTYAYLYHIGRGVPKDEAVRLAYAGTFNYSDVTPFVRRMRSAMWGVPFATFALKAVPQTIETIAKNPARISVFGKIRNDLFKAAGVEGQEELEAMPDYMQDGFYLKLPFKDKAGNSAYFDLSHIIPFGALMDGSFFRDPISQQPILNFVREISKNQTFYGNKIWKEGMPAEEKLARIGFRIAGLVTPAIIRENTIPDGYDRDGNLVFTGMTGDVIKSLDASIEEEPDYWNYVLKQLAIKTSKFNLEKRQKSQEYAKKDALQKVLVDHGILREFTRAYLPEGEELTPTLDREPRPLGR